MQQLKLAFVILAVAVAAVHAKPSHPYGIHAIADHFDFAPPVLPPAHFHGAATPVLPAPAPLLPAPAPLVPAHHATFLPTPALHSHLLPAPAPVLPAPALHSHLVPEPALHSHLLPAPAHFHPEPALHSQLLPAPAHFHPAPALHSHLVPAPATFLPAPEPCLPTLTRVVPPVYEAVQFAAPTYRAIPGPKTTTHHVSVGYAFPAPTFAKYAAPHAHSHSHLHHAAPLLLTGKSGYHHPLF